MAPRPKSTVNVNAKGKPSAKGKVGNIVVGDKFKDNKTGEIYTVTAVDPEQNHPFTVNIPNVGYTSIGQWSYTDLTKGTTKI